MKRPDRFYHAQLDGLEPHTLLELEAREAGHATRVKRHVPGDVIELFDGQGRHSLATITETGRRGGVTIQVGNVEQEPLSGMVLHLASAIPRGDRMDALLDMTTQLGVTRITPLIFERSQTSPAPGRKGRWRRVLIEACKQSRRNHLPQLDEPVALVEWLQETTAAGGVRWLADPEGEVPGRAETADRSSVTGCTVMVGPEGGLTEAERNAAGEAGYSHVAVAPHILRVETAAVAMVTTAARWLVR
jgi:16S rRNA (uracil1498-N3)-methyltransferase